MKVLLDSQAFLWFLLDDPKLRVTVRALIEEPENQIEVSPVTDLEIAIKIDAKKYAMPKSFLPILVRQLAPNDFPILQITPAHVGVLTDVPFHHRDPFDRC